MDVPSSSPEAADAVETSTGHVSDSPAATRPGSASATNPADARAITAPRPPKIRSGAIAAACALAVVLGLTAIPTGPGPQAGAQEDEGPVPRLAVAELPMEGALPALDLGSELGTFAIPGRPVWKDYANGTSACDVWFRAEGIPDAVLAGRIRMTKPVGAATGGDELSLVRSSGDGATGGASFEDASGYAAIEGELFGRGALDGVMLIVDTAKGESARRGSWTGADGTTVDDVVFARFEWTSEGASERDVDVPSSGTGTLTLQLRPDGRD